MNTVISLIGAIVVIIFAVIVIYASLRAHRDNFLTSKLKRKRKKAEALDILLKYSQNTRRRLDGTMEGLEFDKASGKLIKKTGCQGDLELIMKTYQRFESGVIDKQAAVGIYEKLERKLASEAEQTVAEIELLDARLV